MYAMESWGKIKSEPSWYEECDYQIRRSIAMLNINELVLITSYLTSRRDLENWLKVMSMLKKIRVVSIQFKHTVNKYPFGCKVCSIYFSIKSALVFHNQTKHQSKTVEELFTKYFRI